MLMFVLQSKFFFKEIFIYLFILAVLGLLPCAGFLQLWRAGATLHCSARASHCDGFSCCRARGLGARASVVVACGLSSCGSRAQLLHSMWDLPGPGLEPVSPALAGGFLTTAPPGKSPCSLHFDLSHIKILLSKGFSVDLFFLVCILVGGMYMHIRLKFVL